MVLDSNRPAFGLHFSISNRLPLLSQALFVAIAVLLIANTSAPASILRDPDSPGFVSSQSFEATDLFTDTVTLIYFDRMTMFLSGMAAATVWENTQAIFEPLLDATSGVQSVDPWAAEAAANARLRSLQLAALAIIREIGLAALGCWFLSFVAWQIRDTSPRRILR